jgi:hypothetical protein
MKKKQRLVQSGSSLIEGLGNTVTIQSPGNDIEGSNVSVFKQMEQMFGQAKRVFCSSFSCYAACR